MNLKNYTSAVPIERTIARIEQAIAGAGASGITKEYAGGKLVALSFSIVLPAGKSVTIRLPANDEAVYQLLIKKVKHYRLGTSSRLREQAMRTAWKLMQDWVEVQLSLVRMQQTDFLQVFLPYVWDGQRTFYAALKAKNYLALPEAAGESQSAKEPRP